MYLLFIIVFLVLLFWVGARQYQTTANESPEELPEPPRTSEDFKALLPIDGKIFKASGRTWRAEVISDPSETAEHEDDVFLNYGIRFTDQEKYGKKLDMTLATTRVQLSRSRVGLASLETLWRDIEDWLVDREDELLVWHEGKL